MLSGFDSNFSRDDEDVLNEFRQKQVNFDIEERKNEINNSRSLFIGALAGLAMAGVVGWFILSPQYRSSTEAEVPVIRRPQSPVKVQPSEPGTIDISNQDKTVYEIIERKPEETGNEKVLPLPEEPNVMAIETLIDETIEDDGSTGETIVKAESLTTTPTKTAEVKEVKVEAKPEPKAEPKKVEPKPTPAPAAKPKPATAPKGAWQVQLMSSPNKKAVESSWSSMVKKYSILKDQSYEVETADLGEKGIYYRLRAGNFATKDEAARFCNKLKSIGGSCFVARK